MEVISPAGFENYFREMAAVFDHADRPTPDFDRVAKVNERYELEMDFDSVPDLCQRFGLTHYLLGVIDGSTS